MRLSVMGVQAAAAVPAGREALQQRRAFSHGPAGLMRRGVDVGAEARLIGLIGRPVNEALVVIEDQHRPFGAGQAANPPLDRAVGGDGG